MVDLELQLTSDAASITLEFARARAAGAAFAFAEGAQRYLLRGEGGVFSEVSLDWNEELVRDLEAIAGPIGDPGAAARIGERLRGLLDPSGLTALDTRAQARQPIRVEIRAAAAELYALPWEMLALRPTGLWLGQLPETLLSYTWPGAMAAQGAPVETSRLLFAWSDAGGAVPWRAQRDAIRAALDGTVPWDPELDVLPRMTLEGLAQALRAARDEGRPYTALHVLAHGRSGPTGGALTLHGATGAEQVEATALRVALAEHASTLRLAVLCACQSAAYGALDGAVGGLALALHRLGIEAVIGARQPITLHAAQVITETLYPALVRDSVSLEEAFTRARSALRGAGAGLAWTSVQLWLHRDRQGDCRPFVLRPYRGLLPFDVAQANYFHGRLDETRAVARRVTDAFSGRAPRTQLLCGASGSGKSSLIGAALVPEMIASGVRVERLRAEGLVNPTPARDGRRTLVIIDPLDDLFTAIDEPNRRDELAERLRTRSMEPGVVVLAAIRLDLLGRLEELRWGDGRMDSLIHGEMTRLFLTAPSSEALREAVIAPAERVGLSLEPGLADRLLLDAGSEAGALPALQHVLDCLWLRRDGRRLTHTAYQAMGGLSGALAQSAEDAFERLDELGKRRARRVLVSLVSGDGERVAIARRWVNYRALCPDDPVERDETERLINGLTTQRLLLQTRRDGEDQVTLAHDALLRRWEPLRRWALEEGDRSRRLDELLTLARSWSDHVNDPDGGVPYLLRGARLGYAHELARTLDVPPEVTALLQASEASEDAERKARAEALAARERLIDALEATTTRVRDLALLTSAQATHDRDQTLAVQLLREVSDRPPPLDWVFECWSALRRPIRAEDWPLEGEVRLPTQNGPEIRYAVGARVVSRTASKETGALVHLDAPAQAFDAQGETLWILTTTGTVLSGPISGLRRVPHEGRALCDLRVSPGGAYVALGSTSGTIWVIRADGAPQATLRGHLDRVVDLHWSSDDRLLLSASRDGTARLWCPGEGQRLVVRGEGAQVTAARLAPDGRAIVVLYASGGVRCVDSGNGAERWRVTLDAGALCAAWGPKLLVGDVLGRVHILDEHGAVLKRLMGRAEPVTTLRWHTDSEMISATTTTLSRWRLTPEAQVPRTVDLRALPAGIMAFSPQGETLAIACAEHTIKLQRPDGQPPQTLLGHQQSVRALAWRADGGALLSGGNDRVARRWRLGRGASVAVLPHKNVVRAVGWVGEGARFVTGDSSGALRTWQDGEAPAVLDEHDLNDEVVALSRAPDGAWIAALGALGGLLLLSAEGGVWPAPEGVTGLVTGTAWSGETLLCALRTGEMVRLTPASRQVESVDIGGGPLSALAVAADRVATSSPDGAVHVRSSEQSFTLIRPGGPTTRSLRWLGDAGPLVGLTENGAIWAWGLEDLDEPEPVYCDAVITAICASERGDWLAAVTREGGLRIWPFGLSTLRGLLHRACVIPLRDDQRRRYLGDAPPRRR